jgi:deoxyribodipyrimidine photo-lyase
MQHVPDSRVRTLNGAAINPSGSYVLYWMVTARRPHFNFALEHAAAWAKQLGRPLVVLEALRVGYPWASARLHRFALEGMLDNQAAFADSPALYYPYVEAAPGEGAGLVEELAKSACLVVSDEYPCFFVPRMQAKVAPRLSVRFDAVDTNGLLPLSTARGKAYYSAYLFRRLLQQTLASALPQQPLAEPLRGLALEPMRELPAALRQRYPRFSAAQFASLDASLARLPIDHTVQKVDWASGGQKAAHTALARFFDRRYQNYAGGRSHPDDDSASGLSPWLHFGHLSVHEIFRELCTREKWDGVPQGKTRDGRRDGFWGISENGEAFLEELIVWRELAFNSCATTSDFEQYESLPEWTRRTLEEHANDRRTHLYGVEQFERAQTHDLVWNAAQRQLLEEGRIHNYLRMLWGKKIVEWSTSPREAFATMVHLNNKYALDGRDPNSYAGISWVLGRYDRPWAPARPVLGTIRYLSCDAAKKKLRMDRYLARWGTSQTALGL